MEKVFPSEDSGNRKQRGVVFTNELQMFFGNGVYVRQIRDVLKFLTQQFAGGKTLGIGHQTCAHRTNSRFFIAPLLHREPAMSQN